MSLMLIQTALLIPIELMLNQALALDAASKSRLQSLEGKTLAVIASQPKFSLYLNFRNAKLCLSSHHESDVEATLSGNSKNLLQILLQQTPVTNLAPYNIELSGSTSFVKAVQVLFMDLDIDWEFHLSNIIGDLPVAGLSKGVKESKSFTASSTKTIKNNFQEYLLYESELVPSKAAAEQFYQEVSELGKRIDRLNAKLDLINPTE